MNKYSNYSKCAWAAVAALAFALAACSDDDDKRVLNPPPGYTEEIENSTQISVSVDSNDHTHTDGTPAGEDATIYLFDKDGNVVAQGLDTETNYDVDAGTYTVLVVDVKDEGGSATARIESGILKLNTESRAEEYVCNAPVVYVGRQTISLSDNQTFTAQAAMVPYTRPINVEVKVNGVMADDIERYYVTLSDVFTTVDLRKDYGTGASDVTLTLLTPVADVTIPDGGLLESALGRAQLRVLGVNTLSPSGDAGNGERGVMMGIELGVKNREPILVREDVTDILRNLSAATEANPVKLIMNIDMRRDGTVSATISGWAPGWDEEVEVN